MYIRLSIHEWQPRHESVRYINPDPLTDVRRFSTVPGGNIRYLERGKDWMGALLGRKKKDDESVKKIDASWI